MINTTFELVRTLTNRDTKSLSEKGLKLSEECGELAKNILAYQNAAGSMHKFSNKELVAENCIDSILVALSIAYSLGYSDDQLSEIMLKKSLYWSGLRENESNVDPNNIPHELHVTVEKVQELDKFCNACSAADVKPIILDLHSKSNVMKDMMTSSVVIGSTEEAYSELKSIKRILEVYGFNAIRGKIEVPPFHPAVPNKTNGLSVPKDCYFETHIEVIIPNGEQYHSNLLSWADYNPDVHVSKNTFKKYEDFSTVMLTYRAYDGTIESFKEEVAAIREKVVADLGVKLNGKEIIEYCLFDSNKSHDNRWLKL